MKEYARTLKPDAARFDKCLDSGEQAAAVQRDSTQAQRIGLTGTPSFFINGHFWSGAVGDSILREIVEQQLSVALSHKGVSNETKTKTCIETQVVKTAARFY